MAVHFARVQLACECGGVFSTRQRGNTTKHRACGLSRYVPFGQRWEGPPSSTRVALIDPGVWLECGRCFALWEARARPRATVRCPECKHSKRVPTDPVVIAPAGWDTDPDALLIKDAYAEQGGYRRARKRARVIEDDPEGERAARPLTADQLAEIERRNERMAKGSGPAHADRERARQERRERVQRDRERERERFGRPRGDSVLVMFAQALTSQQAGAPPVPQPARPEPVPVSRVARSSRPVAVTPARQSAQGLRQPWAVNLPAVGHRPTAEYLRKIGAPLSETSGTRAGCQFHSQRLGLPCDQPEAVAVMVGSVRVGACADHARIAEQRMAAPRPRG